MTNEEKPSEITASGDRMLRIKDSAISILTESAREKLRKVETLLNALPIYAESNVHRCDYRHGKCPYSDVRIVSRMIADAATSYLQEAMRDIHPDTSINIDCFKREQKGGAQ